MELGWMGAECGFDHYTRMCRAIWFSFGTDFFLKKKFKKFLSVAVIVFFND